MHLEGRATQWFQNLSAVDLGWELFTELVSARFEDLKEAKIIAEFNKLRFGGNYVEYVERFEKLRACIMLMKIGEYTEEYFIASFVSGLSEELQSSIRVGKPTTLHQAIELGKYQMQTLHALSKKVAIEGKTLGTIPYSSKNADNPTSTPVRGHHQQDNNKTSYKLFTATEMAAKWEQGLCYDCYEAYILGHNRIQNILILMDEGQCYPIFSHFLILLQSLSLPEEIYRVKVKEKPPESNPKVEELLSEFWIRLEEPKGLLPGRELLQKGDMLIFKIRGVKVLKPTNHPELEVILLEFQHFLKESEGLPAYREVQDQGINLKIGSIPLGHMLQKKTHSTFCGGCLGVQSIFTKFERFSYWIRGAVAAMVSITFVAPLERLKLEYIVRGVQRILFELIKSIAASQGLRGFWRENFVNILRTTQFKVVNFYAFGIYRNQLLKVSGNKEITNFERVVASAATGIAAVALCIAMDIIETVMVALGGEALGGIIGTFRHMMQIEEFFSLYKGPVPSIISMTLSDAIFLEHMIF